MRALACKQTIVLRFLHHFIYRSHDITPYLLKFMNTKRIKRHSISTQHGESESESVSIASFENAMHQMETNLHLSSLDRVADWLACLGEGRVRRNE